MQTSAAGLLLPAARSSAPASTQRLYNGITLAKPWPPNRVELADPTPLPPYLVDPPAVIDIDVGRQLFVDDFLIEESSLHRTFHRASYHPSNPILSPVREWEREDPYAAMMGIAPSPAAMPFSDGVFYDPRDRAFKLWYMAGYQQYTGLALSNDGISWERPRFDVIPGTNIVFARRRDSSAVWLDLDAREPSSRYKMAIFRLEGRALWLYTSADGIHWIPQGEGRPAGDRSTMFYNPFRKVWVFSLRGEEASGLNRYRRYVESVDFGGATWRQNEPVLWAGADRLDVMRPEEGARPELYNLDAVAYESVLLGLFTMYRGERSQREKPNDVCLAFSRDGFHWHRPWRDAFIPVSDRQGDWNWANVQSAGGGCLIVGDQLYFYISGRTGVPGTSLPGTCRTGLATLRRDGFASLSDQWPPSVPRRIDHSPPGTLTTRPLRFSGQYLFVNAAIDDRIGVEVLDESGRVIEPYAADACLPMKGDSTRHRVQWKTRAMLDGLGGHPVRLRFKLSRARLYSFWVSPSPQGFSRGYVAAGGPGFADTRDMS